MSKEDPGINKSPQAQPNRPRVSLANIVENRRITRTKSDDAIMKNIIEKSHLTKADTDEEDEFDRGTMSINVKGAGTKIDLQRTNDHPRISSVGVIKEKKIDK